MSRALLSLIVFLSAAPATWGDPVPDEVVHEFWDLIVATAEANRCPDPERLAEHFGWYGLDLLEDSHLKAVRKQFDVFAPILAASQGVQSTLYTCLTVNRSKAGELSIS